MQNLTKQDMYDILYGCTILGTGGGGKLEKGLALIDKAFNEGKKITLLDLHELPDDALVACPYYCGSISPTTPEQEEKYKGLPKIDEEPALRAFKVLEEYTGKKFYGAITTELGGSNSAVAFYVAAMLGIYIVDGDPAGRSVPELQHSTFYINEISITPMAVVNEFGDAVIVKNVVNDFRAEAVVRAIAVVSKNQVGVTDHLATGSELRNGVIPGAVTYALKIGRAYREAKEKNLDVAEEIASAGKGYVVFKGLVDDLKWEDRDGFTIGETIIKGERKFAGSSYKIWFKNENIISWKDGVVDITVPDLICLIADETMEPVTNPDFKPGLRVSVIGLPAPKEWRTERGLEIFGPKSFGFDVAYQPIENRYAK
ncbi:MAG: uncharacterized protein PWQ70_1575 [Clostridiales bacterium]|nr:uncharacterized protein [Clostridiales bacterium]